MDAREMRAGPSAAGSAGSPARSSAQRAYEQVKRAILSQDYAGGTLLTEGELADRIGVSRTPIREALLRLEAEGLVQLYPKKGALVRPVSNREVQDVFEARDLVEGFAAGRAWPMRELLVERLTPLLEDMRAHRAAGDAPALVAADRAFHATILAATGNEILVALYDSLRDRQMRMGVAAMLAAPDRMDLAVDEHAALLAALQGDDAEAFQALVHAHVASAAGHLRGLR
jgi:DNA-binding GntR family transcriptional regulator